MILTLFAAIKIHELKFGALRAYIHSSGKGKFAPMTVRIWENCPNVFGASCWCAMFPGGRSGQRQAQVLCWELCGQGFLEDVPYNITKKWKKLFKKKREWLLYFQKESWVQKDGEKGWQKMVYSLWRNVRWLLITRSLLELVLTFPKAYSLVVSSEDPAAGWQYTNLVTQMVLKPSPLRCGFCLGKEPSQFGEFGRKGRSRKEDI